MRIKNLKGSLLLVFMLLGLFSFGQINIGSGKGSRKVSGKVVLKDGSEISGDYKLPLANSKTVSIESSSGLKKLASSEVEYLVIETDTGKAKMFYEDLCRYKSKNTQTVKCSKKGSTWVLEVISGKASLYLGGQRYGVNKSGSVVASSKGQATSVIPVNYFAKLEGRDESLIWVGHIREAIFFKFYGSLFFKGLDEELSNKIRKKEKGFRNNDIEQIFIDFNQK